MYNIFLVFLLVYSIVMLYIFNKISHDVLHPGFLFNAVWMFASTLRLLNVKGNYDLDVNTVLIILLGVICVNFGLIINKKRIVVGKHIHSVNPKEFDTKNRGKIVFYIQLCLTLLLIPLFLKALRFQASYGMAMMRTVYAKGIEYGYMTAFERILYIHVGVFPLNISCVLAQAILCQRKQSKFIYLWYGLINEVFRVVISSSRGNLFLIALIFLYVLLASRHEYNDSFKAYFRKFKKMIKRAVILLVIALFVITIVRHRFNSKGGGLLVGIIGVLQTYFAGGFQLYDLALKSPAVWGLNTLSMGGAALSGLVYALNYFIYYIFTGRHVSIAFLSQNIQTYAEQFYQVGPNSSMNAFVTMFYYFQRDFGIGGIILESIVFGAICMLLYKNMKYTKSFFSQYCFVLIAYVVVFSSVWWVPLETDWWIMLLYGYFLKKIIYPKRNLVTSIRGRR